MNGRDCGCRIKRRDGVLRSGQGAHASLRWQDRSMKNWNTNDKCTNVRVGEINRLRGETLYDMKTGHTYVSSRRPTRASKYESMRSEPSLGPKPRDSGVSAGDLARWKSVSSSGH